MNLHNFISLYDKPNSIVLLEGKRKVISKGQPKLTHLGKLLAENTEHIIFRSGNASGTDYYFSKGVASVDRNKLQVIIPDKNHRKRFNESNHTYSLEEINIVSEPTVIYESKKNVKTNGLIDKYVSGDINRNTIKAAYIIRDTVKVIGTSTIAPASFAIFYDDLNNPSSGGTGHTMQVCKDHNIPYIDQSEWFQWLQ